MNPNAVDTSSPHPSAQILSLSSSMGSPVDSYRLQAEFAVSAELSPQQLREFVLAEIGKIDHMVRIRQGSGVGCESACMFDHADGTKTVRVTLFALKAGEEAILKRVEMFLESGFDPDLSHLPIYPATEDEIEEYEEALANSERGFASIYKKLDTMKAGR
jgi:hypothetical protein